MFWKPWGRPAYFTPASSAFLRPSRPPGPSVHCFRVHSCHLCVPCKGFVRLKMFGDVTAVRDSAQLSRCRTRSERSRIRPRDLISSSPGEGIKGDPPMNVGRSPEIVISIHPSSGTPHSACGELKMDYTSIPMKRTILYELPNRTVEHMIPIRQIVSGTLRKSSETNRIVGFRRDDGWM